MIAVFAYSPDRQFLNNAVLARGLTEVGEALDRIERAYAERGIGRYAVWAHESEAATVGKIEAQGYTYDSSTRSMAMPVADLADVDTPYLDLTEPSPDEFSL